MEEIEKVGRTVDEAVDKAIAELGISREEANVVILEEPSRGILGIWGSRPAKVRVSVNNTFVHRTRNFLNSIFKAMELYVDVNVEENGDTLLVNLQGNGLGILIGRRGETLNALQYLVNLCMNKNQIDRRKIVLDVEGYRRRREQTLERLAFRLANKAIERGRNVVLEPMSPQERRIIHTALQSRNDIYTYSEGEEPYRKIVISPRRL